MKLSKVFKYQTKLFVGPVLTYFLIIIGLYIVGWIPSLFTSNGEQIFRFSGFDVSGIVFIFVMGLCSFKPSFRFLIGNSISRKTQFWGTVMSFLVLAAFVGAVTTLFSAFFPVLSSYTAIFYMIYNTAFPGLTLQTLYTSIPFLLTSFLWTFSVFLAAVASGYFLTTLAYRMNKAVKLLFFIGMPALFLIVIPIVDTYITGMTIYSFLARCIVNGMGLMAVPPNPFIGSATFLGITVVCLGLSYLCIRRAVLKEG
jgi:hypothetical protein